MALPTAESLVEALRPSSVTAAMHTTAMRATRKAYSTREAPRSVRQRACIQAVVKAYEVIIRGLRWGLGAGDVPHMGDLAWTFRPRSNGLKGLGGKTSGNGTAGRWARAEREPLTT